MNTLGVLALIPLALLGFAGLGPLVELLETNLHDLFETKGEMTMPPWLNFKDAATVILCLLVCWVAWDWFHTNQALAQERVQHKADINTLATALGGANATIDRMDHEQAASQAATLAAETKQREAEKRYDRARGDLEKLARQNADVRTYLDSRMPDALYQQLRQPMPPGPGAEGDHHTPAAKGPGPVLRHPDLGRANECGSRCSLAAVHAPAREVQRERGGPGQMAPRT